MLLVNTWRTKRTPWLVKYVDADAKVPVDLVKRVHDAVASLPVRIHVPPSLTSLSLPRYYLLVYSGRGIEDIVGVRHDMSPTKWSYRLGYWHPRCQLDIANALEEYVEEVGGR